MRKKKITETVPAGPLDDLPEKIVSDEDPEDDEDDDSEEAGEAEEPDEEKHSSSSREEPASPTSAIRKSLNLPGGVRSGNIPAVPSSDPEAPLGRDNNGDPISRNAKRSRDCGQFAEEGFGGKSWEAVVPPSK